jgi:hypothetical protein
MTITSIKRVDVPNSVSIVVMETDDSIEDVVSTGWLGRQSDSIISANNGNFTFRENDVLLIYITSGGVNLFTVFPDFLSVNPIGYIFPTDQALTAYAGGGQANATQLKLGGNVVTVVATNGDSVKLPDDVLGQTVIVRNEGAHTLNIFPFLGDQIENLGVNTATTLASNGNNVFYGVKTTGWALLS